MAAFLARGPFNGTGSKTFELFEGYQSLRIINTGADDLTFSISPHFTYTMSPGEIFDEQVDSFTVLKITGNSEFRGFVRKEVR